MRSHRRSCRTPRTIERRQCTPCFRTCSRPECTAGSRHSPRRPPRHPPHPPIHRWRRRGRRGRLPVVPRPCRRSIQHRLRRRRHRPRTRRTRRCSPRRHPPMPRGSSPPHPSTCRRPTSDPQRSASRSSHRRRPFRTIRWRRLPIRFRSFRRSTYRRSRCPNRRRSCCPSRTPPRRSMTRARHRGSRYCRALHRSNPSSRRWPGPARLASRMFASSLGWPHR